MDYFLKANSEQELMTKLAEVGAVESYSVKNDQNEELEVRYRPATGVDLDIIGTIYKPTSNVIQTEEGFEVPETAPLDGFHANLRGPLDLSEKIEYIPYQPTEEELKDPNFVMPEPEKVVTPSPIADILVYPKNPVRVWA